MAEIVTASLEIVAKSAHRALARPEGAGTRSRSSGAERLAGAGFRVRFRASS